MSNTNEEIVTFEIAKIAKEKGFNEPVHYYYNNNSALIEHSGHINAGWYKKAPTYHQLIDWVFKQYFMTDGWRPTYNDPDNSGLHPEAKPNYPAFITHYEFWYNILKDCPLKGHFIYQLEKWFEDNNYTINTHYIDFQNDQKRIYDYSIPELTNEDAWFEEDLNYYSNDRDGAKHKGVLKIFQLLKQQTMTEQQIQIIKLYQKYEGETKYLPPSWMLDIMYNMTKETYLEGWTEGINTDTPFDNTDINDFNTWINKI